MPDTLSISLTPGYLPEDDELIDNSILRLIARPSITLTGSIGSATISDSAVTTAKLADGALSADTTGRNKMSDGFLTAAKLNASQDWSGKTLTGNPAVTWSGAINFSSATFTPPPGMLVQQVQNSTVALSTLTAAGSGTGDLSAATSGVIPIDDTLPQNTEGAQLLSVAITPKSATNILEIEVVIPFANSGGNGVATVALFNGGTDAIAVATSTASAATNVMDQVVLRHRLVAGGVGAITFTVRVGVAANTMTINGANAARLFGGVSRALLLVKEITAS